MSFDFNWYSSPLLFGFLQGWIYAVLFWLRAWRSERLSDALFGALLAALTFEIWEYMLGFAGIDVLWNELEFFPRNFGLLIPALAWLYLRSQFNAQFRLLWQHTWHILPFLVYCTYHLVVFSQGRDFVSWWQEQVHLAWGIANLEAVLSLILTVFYFYRAYRLYQHYRSWAPTQFSTPELVSFTWFRNFLWAVCLSSLISWSMTIIDIWLALDFWHDWWDELFNAGLIYYLSVTGYAQTQVRHLVFDPVTETEHEQESPKSEKISENELAVWRQELTRLMESEKLYLEPELALADLARRLNSNVSILSAAINRAFGKNFNDYVNGYRVEQVKQLLKDPAVAHLSLLGIGLECGFNSKATFNRAFKKATGMSPREYSQEFDKTG